MAKEKHENKSQETEKLIQFARQHELLIDSINKDEFISAGAEQKVYIKDGDQVIKLNDAIYYASWEDYFHNLLLHNYFFADTSYQLTGFHLDKDTLYAVVEQVYVKADQITDLSTVRTFLAANGFQNAKRHDYYNPDLGIIIEDLHDENVLTNERHLYFIDTVFYINPQEFWRQ